MKGNLFIKRLKTCFNILVKAGTGFADDKAPKLSAALAYNTIFSLPPMLLLIIVVGGTFYGEQAITGQLFGELKQFVGDDTAMQVQEVMSKINFQKNSTVATIISVVILIMGATGIFVEIQDSLNMIWGVRAKAKKGFVKILLSRLLSFTMIIGFGFLLIVSLILNAVILGFSDFILKQLPFIPVNMIGIVNTLFTFTVLLVLFMAIFKMLPDVKIKWRQVLPGAIVTTLLFFFGKYLIGLYISGNTMASLYGAAGSVIVLLLWIYFSSFILYFGAEFTKAYIEHFGGKIRPNSFAEYTEKILLKEYLEQDALNKTADQK
ncbi:MAG: YihY/virulence factor BrkB family protein [Sphingobacteriales bacterium]|nr:MAG: YihY/virulence factor BrkB family protein [Sphingobacteriales bacterium]